MSCHLGNHRPLVGCQGPHGYKKASRGSAPSPVWSPPPQRRTESGCDHRACLLQVAAYGGKLRYSLSYTAGAQGSPLSDPDVQITVSTWVPHQADRRERQRQGTPSVFLSSRSSTQLTRHPPTGRAHAPTPPFGHYPGRGPAGRQWGQWAPT